MSRRRRIGPFCLNARVLRPFRAFSVCLLLSYISLFVLESACHARFESDFEATISSKLRLELQTMIFSGRKGQNRVCVFTFNFARPSGEKESTETYYDRENYDVAEYVNIFLMFLKRMNLFLSFLHSPCV